MNGTLCISQEQKSHYIPSSSFAGGQNHTQIIQHDFTKSSAGHTPHQYWGKFHLLQYGDLAKSL